MAQRPRLPVYKQRRVAREKRAAAAKAVKEQARRKLPWVLGALALVVLGFMIGAGVLFYRSSRTLATLHRLDGVVSWVDIYRDNTRYHPYILRLNVENRTMQRFLGPTWQHATRYSYALHMGDSVRVYYDTESPSNLSFIYQLEKNGEILMSLHQIQAEDRAMAVGFSILSLLPFVLLLPNRHVRMLLMTYFRRLIA